MQISPISKTRELVILFVFFFLQIIIMFGSIRKT